MIFLIDLCDGHSNGDVQYREETWPRFSADQHLSVLFLRKHADKKFGCGHRILTEGVFVTELSGDAGISVGRVMWVVTNCCIVRGVTGYNSGDQLKACGG